MLKVDHIYKTFNPGTINEKTALNGTTLTLNEGDFVTVIGGNGAGKSTLLNAIAGVFLVDEGSISIDDVDVTRMSEHRRASFLGRVFQDPMMGTAATMGIDENLALAARRGKSRGLGSGITKAERAHYKELLKELDLGLENRLTSKVGLLSGGQRQRVALARALATSPRILLMDEPFAALDAMTREQLYQDIQEIHLRCGMTIVFVTHNMREAVCLGDRVVLLTPHPGRVCEEYFVDFPHPRDINSSDLAELSARITRDLKGATA